MASQMKSAGKASAKVSAPSNGWWRCADGMAPESNQASSTGARRVAVASQPSSGQGKVMSSTYGRWRSSAVRSAPASSASCATDPTHVSWRSVQRQMGSGVPQ